MYTHYTYEPLYYKRKKYFLVPSLSPNTQQTNFKWLPAQIPGVILEPVQNPHPP